MLAGCAGNSKKDPIPSDILNEKEEDEVVIDDPHSFSEPDDCIVTHLNWTLNVDFNAKVLSGVASWKITNLDSAEKVIFDTKHLTIEKIWLDENEETTFDFGEEHPDFGQALTVAITPTTQVVNIQYETAPDAEALMWLDPEQTQGKQHPFLFTQSQAILARTWIPCQDGPGVRYTYEATVTTPDGLMAAMSASNPTEKSPDNTYHFTMNQPVPSYLMALVCGDLEFKAIGERTGVYAEPALIDAATYELGEMQSMLEKAEKLYGDYRWERYDVVFLPPSFPFGGMENPRLTFATPTIIAGDRSLTALIAHELAHSWSGNLVTNATWDDFWLNEGFTVYFEQRIMEDLYGRDYSEMLALLSFQGLIQELEDFEEADAMEDTHLKLDLKGRNPDDGLTAIAYDKGYLFLRMLEETFGRETFDNFLKNYFNENAFKVMTTEKFLAYLNDNLLSKDEAKAKSCQIDAWIYGPGLPENCPKIDSERLQKLDALMAQAFEGDAVNLDGIDTTGWSAHEYIYFVANLPKDLTLEGMGIIDSKFDFTNSTNNEILGQWFKWVARLRYEEGFDAMSSFLVQVGRRKFLTPIYKELVASDEGMQQAKAIYEEARPNYHAVSRGTIESLLATEEIESTTLTTEEDQQTKSSEEM